MQHFQTRFSFRLSVVAGCAALISMAATTTASAASPSWCNAGRSFSPAEQAICDSRKLSELDRRMSAAYAAARRTNPNARGDIKQAQRAWLARRNDCGGRRGCLVNRYREQLDWLDGYGGHSVEPVPAVAESDGINPWRTKGYRRCFNFVMSGRVQWGGGTRWQRQNAAWLCEASTDVSERPPEPVYCFRQQRTRGLDWRSAIRLCRNNRGLVEGSAQQTEINRRNGAQPQRTGNNVGNGNEYDPAEENDGYDEPQYNDGVDHSEDNAGGNPYCGWWAIYTCHRSRDRAINDMNNNGYGGVVDTNDVPNFRNGYYCVADGPFPRKRRARKLRNRARGDYQSAYVKNGC